MEDDIDLRAYVSLLLNRWKLIAALIVCGALVAGGVAYTTPRSYEAEAMLSVSQPRYSLKLDGVSQGAPLPLKAYPDLALSDGVLNELYRGVKVDLPDSVNTLDKFRSRLRAQAGADPTLLRLIVRDENAQDAAAIANAWARLLTQKAGELYAQDNANLTMYETQLADVKVQLEQADKALAVFQAQNQAGILQVQLTSQQAILSDYFLREHEFKLLLETTADVLSRLQSLDAAAPASFTDEVVRLMISAQAADSQMSTGTETSSLPKADSASSRLLQVQVNTDPLAGLLTVADQRASLDALAKTLDSRVAEFRAAAGELEPAILDLQGQLAEARRRETELTRTRDLVEKQYLALSSKLDEAHIAVQESNNVVQLASAAAAPTEPSGLGRSVLIGAGALLGALVGGGLTLVQAWWRSDPRFGRARPA